VAPGTDLHPDDTGYSAADGPWKLFTDVEEALYADL
jgi:hypothetical protein